MLYSSLKYSHNVALELFCDICGCSENLHRHRIVPGSYIRENVVTICAKCHGKVHKELRHKNVSESFEHCYERLKLEVRVKQMRGI